MRVEQLIPSTSCEGITSSGSSGGGVGDKAFRTNLGFATERLEIGLILELTILIG